jgi:hypothetical protein
VPRVVCHDGAGPGDAVNTAIADRLKSSRAIPPVASSQLRAAALHLKTARLCLLTWIRESYVNSNNVTENVETIEDLLRWSGQIENLRGQIDVKSSLLGEGPQP